MARSHEIVVQPEPGGLVVTETILVANPTSECYVGRSEQEGQDPVTMNLAISPDFLRATFHQEFFGRRFSTVGDKLATSIPWQPGTRELKFTYILPNEQGRRKLERPLDLPCSHVRLRVRALKPEEVICNLRRPAGEHGGEVVFESGHQTLPAGHVIRLELGALPVPWAVYGRWLATAVLVGLVGIAGRLAIRDRRGHGDGKEIRPKANRS